MFHQGIVTFVILIEIQNTTEIYKNLNNFKDNTTN